MPSTVPLIAASRPATARPQAVVAVLAGPEPALLVRCLCALALQRNAAGLWPAPDAFGAVVMPTGPATPLLEAVRGLGPALPFPVRVTAPAPDGSWALRTALAAAADWLWDGGPVLATRSEAVPEPCWLAHAVAALTTEADIVLGEVMAPGGWPDGAARYATLLATLAARLDPDPDDPNPAHGQEDTANFAIDARLLAALGGLPAGPAGGLPGLLATLRRQDARIRHLPGMRVEAALPPAPVAPALAVWRRLVARRTLREFWTAGIGSQMRETEAFRRCAARLGLQPGALGATLAMRHFGAAWEAVEATSPVLAMPALPPSALPRESLKARFLLAAARLAGPRRRSLTLPAATTAQRAGGPAPGGVAPAGICTLRYPAGGWNRAGSWGP